MATIFKKYLVPMLLMALVMVFLTSFALAQVPAWKTKDYKFTMTPATSSQFIWAAYAMKVIQADTGLKITVLESAGTEENNFRMQNKVADFGQYDVILLRKKLGEKHDIRQIFAFSPAVWQLAVAKDANIKSIKDLHGKKWNPGPVGGGSTHITMQVMDLFGIKPNYHQATLNDAVEAYADRQIVGLSYRGMGAEPTGAFVEAHSARPLIFINFTDEELAKIHQKFDYLTEFEIPPKVYPDQNKPIKTFASWTTGIGANKNMPAEAIYEVVKSYWKNHKDITKQFPGVAKASPVVSVNESLILLHVGAIKYYKEIGLKIPTHLIPPEAK